MASRYFATANKHCVISWKCIHCGTTNLQPLVLSVTTKLATGLFSPSFADQANCAGNDHLAELMNEVNFDKKYTRIPSGGKCKTCRKTQPWSAGMVMLGSVILSLIYGVFFLRNKFTNSILEGIIFCLLFFLVANIVLTLIDKVIRMIRIASMKKKITNPECYPLIARMPVHINYGETDSRKEAINRFYKANPDQMLDF